MPETMIDRTSVDYWREEIDRFDSQMRETMLEYRQYSRWFDGHMDDARTASFVGTQGLKVDSNLHHLVARSSRAQLFYRAPRFLVEPFETFGVGLFTKELAQVETMLLNDWSMEVDLYREGRRAIMDGFLGPEMIFKQGYSADVGVDTDAVDGERLRAQEQSLEIIQGGTPRVLGGDIHSIFIDELERLQVALDRTATPASQTQGEALAVPDAVKEFIQTKIDRHKERVPNERPQETIRSERVFGHRVSPLRFFYDVNAESPARREWVGEAFLKPVKHVREDTRYEAGVRETVTPTTDTRDRFHNQVNRRKNRQEQTDDMVVIYEIVDLREGKVITYAQDGNKPLRVVDYKLKDVLPAGPYVSASFSISPLDDQGIPPPRIYASEQAAYTLLKSAMVQVARRITPMLGLHTRHLSEKTQKELASGKLAFLLNFDKELPPGMSIKDLIQPVPTPQIPSEMAGVAAKLEHDIERLSGLGSAGAGGGDFSKTATASAIVNESVNSLSDDLASVLDDFLSRVGRNALRLQRRFYTRAKVGELVGEGAMRHWPHDDEDKGGSGWRERDIKNDRGVNVVPGSTTRANTAVQQRMLTDIWSATAADQSIPAAAKVELLQRVLTGAGFYGIKLDGMAEMVQLQQAQALAEGEQQAGPRPGGARPAERASRRAGANGGGENSQASHNQSAQNPGGGRTPSRAGR